MKRERIAALFFLVSLTVVSCSKFSNGDPVTEERSLGAPFDIICMYNNVNVHLVESRHPHLKLTCPKNLVDNIVTEVRNDSLIIRNDNTFNWLRRYDYSIDLTVYYDSLREINYASIGTLTTQDSLRGRYTADNDSIGGGGRHAFMLRTKEGCGDIDLTFSCDVLRNRFFNGTSCIVLRGMVGYAEHIVRSYGTVHAEEMNSNMVTVQHESTNDLYVWVRDGGHLHARLNSIGNLYYRGNPKPSNTHIECTGDGRAIPME
jgi:hypothetical protein